MQSDEPVLPLEPCASWADAEAIARDALAYILQDGGESGVNRIRAAELVLQCTGGKLGERDGGAVVPIGTFEDYLRQLDAPCGL